MAVRTSPPHPLQLPGLHPDTQPSGHLSQILSPSLVPPILNPATPVHSPHPSQSSTSSRTPLGSLSLHEYRKLQNSPASLSATPPGKSLRRKPAASGLNELQRAPSLSKAPRTAARASYHPLHFSQSAQHLPTYQALPPSPPFQPDTENDEQAFRSRSAEPVTTDSRPPSNGCPDFAKGVVSKSQVRNWKPIKRLPKPQDAVSSGSYQSLSSSSLASLISARQRLPLEQPCSPTGNYNAPAGSTDFSANPFSDVTRPPEAVEVGVPTSDGEKGAPLVNISFATTAPATPPATPAVIHYRGTSFDLINPHESLLLQAIETPARDRDSPEYFAVGSSDEPFLEKEMAPRRIYNDLSQAYKSITKRDDENPSGSQLNLPLPPNRALLSPESAAYPSPDPDTDASVSPLRIRKTNESRFSLRNLTRSLTKRIAKGQDQHVDEQELQENLSSPLEGRSRPLQGNDAPPFVRESASAPLTSLLPSSMSAEDGRGAEPRVSMSEGAFNSTPYYDNASIYPASSVYTKEDRPSYPPSLADQRRSIRTTGTNQRWSNVPDYWKETGGHRKSKDVGQGDLSGHPSRLPGQDQTQQMRYGGEHTDTLSKFVGYYENGPAYKASGDSTTAVQNQATRFSPGSGAYNPPRRPQLANATSGLSKFDFNLDQDGDPEFDESLNDQNAGEFDEGVNDDATLYGYDEEPVPIFPTVEPLRLRNPAVGRSPGSAPQALPPLPPSFGTARQTMAPVYHPSEILSGVTSYGDTRQLLQLSSRLSGEAASPMAPRSSPMVTQQVPQASSSYSQPDGTLRLASQSAQPSRYFQADGPSTPRTPEAALQQAQEIFDRAGRSPKKEDGIPTIWNRRSSGSHLTRNKSAAADSTAATRDSTASNPGEQNEKDWITVGNNSHNYLRPSLDESIADFSSDDELPSFDEPGPASDHHALPRSSAVSSQQSVTGSNPFVSSPPHIGRGGEGVQPVPNDNSSNSYYAEPRSSTTVPLFHSRLSYRNHQDHYKPVPNNYANLSDKETMELLSSGPNDEILYEAQAGPVPQGNRVAPSRENTYDKLVELGPKGNYTGTPLGTGMREAGSSIADSSSPGAAFSSSSPPAPSPSTVPSSSRFNPFRSNGKGKERADLPQSPLSQTVAFSSPISESKAKGGADLPQLSPSYGVTFSSPTHGRAESANTLFPGPYTPDQGEIRASRTASVRSGPLSIAGSHRSSLKLGRVPSRSGRPAVAGQTKLRKMILSGDNMSSISTQTRITHVMGSQSQAGASVGTLSPLHPHGSATSVRQNIVSEHSPHLLFPERIISPIREQDQLKKSKTIFFCFCVLPPLLLLYFFGLADLIISAWTKGRIPECHGKWKNRALWTGFVGTFVVAAVVLIPVLVARDANIL